MRIKLCRVCGLKQKRYENVAEEIYEMVIIIESLIGILLFTILIVPLTLKNRLTSVGDYPPAIREKCMELGLIEKREQRFTKADILRKGFRDAYLIWLTIDWYDALVLDCIWFCHSKKVRIPGTEDMEEYKDYRFHIKQSCIGMLLGLPACLAVGVITAIL